MNALANESVVLSGIKPTGRPHLGNYLGMIQPSLDLAEKHGTYLFIADYHALTTMRDPQQLTRRVYELAATWLALGLDPHRAVFYRQSAVPEIFELMWVLSCTAAKGVLNRAHAYKAAVKSNLDRKQDQDADINAGLYNYPLLMAADILTLGAHIVPVGRDQKQHVEIARDAAGAFNQHFGQVLVLPEPLINEIVETIPGVDGRKMSKSYGNEIPLLAQPDELRQRVMSIVTDSRKPEEAKNPDACNLFRLYRHFALPDDVERTRAHYLRGGLAYKPLKEELSALLAHRFASARERYQYFLTHPDRIDRILSNGASKARIRARETLNQVRKSVGISDA